MGSTALNGASDAFTFSLSPHRDRNPQSSYDGTSAQLRRFLRCHAVPKTFDRTNPDISRIEMSDGLGPVNIASGVAVVRRTDKLILSRSWEVHRTGPIRVGIAVAKDRSTHANERTPQ
jgi:hypothetical protein